MKTLKTTVALIFFTLFLFCVTSCMMLLGPGLGNHRGWEKNSNNRHHNHSTFTGHDKGESEHHSHKH
jgi:hypothetical protein